MSEKEERAMTKEECLAYAKQQSEKHPAGLIAAMYRHNEACTKQAVEFEKKNQERLFEAIEALSGSKN